MTPRAGSNERASGHRGERPNRRDESSEHATVRADQEVEAPAGPAFDAMSDAAPADVLGEAVGRPHPELEGLLDDDVPLPPLGALAVIRRGLAVSPELRRGIRVSFVFAVIAAIGKLTVPILVQLVLQHGILGPGGFRPGFVYGGDRDRGRDHRRRALAEPPRVHPARARGRGHAVRPARARVRAHPPPQPRRPQRDEEGHLRVACHERHRDARALRAMGCRLVGRERHVDRRHVDRHVRVLVAARARRHRRLSAGAADLPHAPARSAPRVRPRARREPATCCRRSRRSSAARPSSARTGSRRAPARECAIASASSTRRTCAPRSTSPSCSRSATCSARSRSPRSRSSPPTRAGSSGST